MVSLRQLLLWVHRAIGVGLGVALMQIIVEWAAEPQARIPFVTSLVLVIALPDNEGARSRNIILGHVVSGLAGVLVLNVIGSGFTQAAIAVGVAVLFMQIARAVHPPAGINPLIIDFYDLPIDWVFSPILVGALIVAAYAWAWAFLERNLYRTRSRTPKALEEKKTQETLDTYEASKPTPPGAEKP